MIFLLPACTLLELARADVLGGATQLAVAAAAAAAAAAVIVPP